MNVFFVAVIIVVGNVAGLILENLAGRMGELIPDGGAAPILGCAALNLIGGGCAPPKETVREGVVFTRLARLPGGCKNRSGYGRRKCGYTGSLPEAPASEFATRHKLQHRSEE